MAAPSFKNFTGQDLAAKAGGDPWKLNDEIQTGRPGAINDLADAFHITSGCVVSVEDDFQLAKEKFEQGWRHNGNEHPINGSAEVSRVTTKLNLQKTQLAEIAVKLEQVAASLASAQRSSDDDIGLLNAALHHIDDQITTAKANGQDSQAIQSLIDSAVATTNASLSDVRAVRNGYIAAMKSAESTMLADTGYVADVIDPIDGQPQDDAASEADQYKRAYLSADEALVQQASASGATDTSRAAAARLRDYSTIADPASSAEARRLAGERLNDHRMANIVGPLPKDPVLGGDARTRAQGRLQMQALLEKYAATDRIPMSQDQITQMMDESEPKARALVINRTKLELEHSGMTPEGASNFIEAVERGNAPADLVKALSGAADGHAHGVEALAEAQPTGKHWGEHASKWSAEDIEAVGKFGKYLGHVGTVGEVGLTLYEISQGASPVESISKLGGSLGGAWLLGSGGAEVGVAIAGPPGALILGTVGAIGGGILGEAAVEKAFEAAGLSGH